MLPGSGVILPPPSPGPVGRPYGDVAEPVLARAGSVAGATAVGNGTAVGDGHAPVAAGTPVDIVVRRRAPPTPRRPSKSTIRQRRLVAAVALVGIGTAVGSFAYRTISGTASRPPVNNAEREQPAPTAPSQVVGGRRDGTAPIAGWVTAENARPGSSGWKMTDPARNGEIAGYAGTTSVTVGQPFSLYVSTTALSFHVEAYRMGFYHGTGGRLIWTSPETTGVSQPRATLAPVTNMVEAGWQPSIGVATSGWVEGAYLLKLVAGTGKEQYVPMTVRNDRSTAAYAIVNAVTTWQAYNMWGGYDLYEGKNGNGSDFAHRSRIVSFDRPYRLGDGAGDFLGLEYPAVSLAESLGLDVTYLTDVDLDLRADQLVHHRAVLTMGHDEYYSLAMRNGLESARDHGVNLAFLGANAVFRHIRFDSSPLGPDRRIIDYKSAHEDPFNGWNNADVTVSWRDPPNNRPESQLIGNLYQCNPVHADMVVVDPSNWLFAGTNAVIGQRLSKAIGSEYDRYDPTVPGPANVEILTHSPVDCHGKSDFSDATYYTAASGAGVFASGTNDFVVNLDPNCVPVGCAGRFLSRVMANLLAAFGAGPAGLAHPSIPGQSTVKSRPPVSPPDSTTSTTFSGGVPSTDRSRSVPSPTTAPASRSFTVTTRAPIRRSPGG